MAEKRKSSGYRPIPGWPELHPELAAEEMGMRPQRLRDILCLRHGPKWSEIEVLARYLSMPKSKIVARLEFAGDEDALTKGVRQQRLCLPPAEYIAKMKERELLRAQRNWERSLAAKSRHIVRIRDDGELVL